MSVLTYCNSCYYPHTKPDLYFEAGKCSACLAFDERKNIDWNTREREFEDLCISLRDAVPNGGYHCIVPVSGGKDSTAQVLKCLEYKLNVLAVCAITDDLSNLGRQNLNNIANLGVDVIEIKTNPVVRKKINKYTLNTIGDISWAEHVTIFTIPVQEAINRKIPAIIWGENPQNEYGGPKENQTSNVLGKKWLAEFGGLNGLRVTDLLYANVASSKELLPYVSWGPFMGKSIFLGYYFPWDGYKNYQIAKEAGFKEYNIPITGSGITYENLDNYQTGIHDYFKWLKFGFGRATDIANNLLRRDMFTKDEAKKHILKYDGEYPDIYLGKRLYDILGDIDVTTEEFDKICYKFTNKELFEVSLQQHWFKAEPRFHEDLKNA